MIYRFSELINTLKTQNQFDKWVETIKANIKDLAYENCNVIDKRSIVDSQNKFDSVKKAYKPLKKLYKKSSGYDASFIVTKQGYVEFYVYFPITEKDAEMARECRQKEIAEIGKFGDICVRQDEVDWKLFHEKVYKTINFAKPMYDSFEKVDRLVRKMKVCRFI